MRLAAILTAALMTASCQAPVQAQRNWAKPTFGKVGDEILPKGWQGTAATGLSPAPGDPVAPMVIVVEQKGKVDGAAAFANALRVAKITGAAEIGTTKQQTMSLVPNFENSQAWTSGATTNAGGVKQALFARTNYDHNQNATTTTLYRTPVHTVQSWGGLKYYVTAAGIEEVFQTFTAKDWAEAASYPPAKQAKVFNDVFDGWIVGMAQQNMAIQQGTLDMMKGINKDWATRANCAASSNCSYVPGATPGAGRSQYN